MPRQLQWLSVSEVPQTGGFALVQHDTRREQSAPSTCWQSAVPVCIDPLHDEESLPVALSVPPSTALSAPPSLPLPPPGPVDVHAATMATAANTATNVIDFFMAFFMVFSPFRGDLIVRSLLALVP